MEQIPDIADPFALFSSWLSEARQQLGEETATSFTLATASKEGIPSARVVLLKGQSPEGFAFYTNLGSNKARDLLENPHAAMCFYWESLGRQVRIQGKVARVSDSDADAYFSTRHRESQLGAWASRQSDRLESRKVLMDRVASFDEQFGPDEVPRPEFWSGFRLHPDRFEFWIRGESRLHDRRLYLPNDQGGWDRMILSP